jgi:hypothetical protein
MGPMRPVVLFVAPEDLHDSVEEDKDKKGKKVDESIAGGDAPDGEELQAGGSAFNEESAESKAKRTPVVSSILEKIAANRDNLFLHYSLFVKVINGEQLLSQQKVEADEDGIEVAAAVAKALKLFEKDRDTRSKKEKDAAKKELTASTGSCFSNLDSNNKVMLIYNWTLTKTQLEALVEVEEGDALVDGIIEFKKFTHTEQE